MADSEDTLYNSLKEQGFTIKKDNFLDAYHVAHQKYRKVRYEQFREVSNAIWVSEALCNLGIKVDPEDSRVKAALNIFFQDFIDTLELRVGAKKLLAQTQAKCKVGLISNFTHAPVIYKSLRKIGICNFFNAVVVSEDVGWRKPCSQIFQDMLNRLQIKAEDAIYVGDSPIEDIRGAKEAGLKTIFVSSQFNKLADLKGSNEKPNFIAKSLLEVIKSLDCLFSAN